MKALNKKILIILNLPAAFVLIFLINAAFPVYPGRPGPLDNKLFNKYNINNIDALERNVLKSENNINSDKTLIYDADSQKDPQKNGNNFISAFNPENKDISPLLLEKYTFTWKKPANTETAFVDFDFLMIFHPEMQFFLPEQNSFIKGASPGLNPEKLQFLVNEKLKKAASDKNYITQRDKIKNSIEKIKNDILKLSKDKNKEYEAAHKRTKGSLQMRPQGPVPESAEEFKTDTSIDYPEMLKKIDSVFKIKREKLENSLKAEYTKLNNLRTENLKEIYTSLPETALMFKKISDDIDSHINAYCEKSGYKTVFNSSFNSLQNISESQNPRYDTELSDENSNAVNPAFSQKSKSFYPASQTGGLKYDDLKISGYIKFLDSGAKLKTYDNGSPRDYIDELRNWYNENKKIKNALFSVRSGPFLISGGRDITDHIIFLVFKKYSMPPEKTHFVIDMYKRIQNDKKTIRQIHSE